MRGGQAVICSKTKPPATHFLVVVEIRATAAPAAVRNMVREHPTQPQCVIAEMGSHEEASSAIWIVKVFAKGREGLICLVIRFGHAHRSIAQAELHEYRRDVICQDAIVLTEPAKGVADDHVCEERQRGARPLPRTHQRDWKPRVVKHVVDAAIRELSLHDGQLGTRITRNEPANQLCVSTSQLMSSVCENHVDLQWMVYPPPM